MCSQCVRQVLLETVVTPYVGLRTHEAAVENPGSHQQEAELEEDEVVMIPRTWKTLRR